MRRATEPDPTSRALVDAELGRQGVQATAEVADGLAGYVVLLARWSARIRLTATSAPEVLVQRHLADALALHRLLSDAALSERYAAATTAVDVGAGAGLPGLPLAILRPQLRMTLVEANGRKCAFMRTAAHELGLALEIVEARVETLGARDFDLVCSRATWAPAEWLAHARDLTAGDGLVAVFAARQAPTVHGFETVAKLDYRLADDSPRLVALYRCVG